MCVVGGGMTGEGEARTEKRKGGCCGKGFSGVEVSRGVKESGEEIGNGGKVKWR